MSSSICTGKASHSHRPESGFVCNEVGMVSIMVTMIMIVVISLIVLGFAQVTRNNQRSALDRQLSTQAFYAAETGINDAKTYVRANPLTPTTTTCGQFITTAGLTTKSKLTTDGSVAYTCLTVNNNPNTLRFQTVAMGNSIVTPLFSGVNIPSLTFSWQANSVGSTDSADCSTGSTLPASVGAGAWDCGYGLLRLDLVPDNGASGASGLASQTKTFFFKPSNSATASPSFNNFTSLGGRGTLANVRCSSVTRTCSASLNMSGAASTTRYYARISAVYRALQNVVISSSNPSVGFSGAQAIIDSTGKSQDVLRRLQVRMSLLSNTQVPGNAIESTGELCKLISVSDGFANNLCSGGVPTGGTPTTPTVGVVMDQIDVGNYHVCANSLAGDGFCWGKNDFGQLGNGTNNNRSTPFAVTTSGVLAGKTIVGTAAGYNHTCVVDNLGKVYCWGYNSQGQLGNGRSAIDNNPFPTAVVTTGPISGKKVIKVNAGDAHTCAITDDGSAYCWGGNIYGQLGTGGTANSFVPAAVNTSGVLNGKTVVDISAGYQHTCVVTSDGGAYCWGFNSHGQLGNNSLRDSSVPVAVAGGLRFKRITAGHHHTCAITTAGAAYCWGNGEQGRLGNGGMSNSSVPVAVRTSGVLAGKQVTNIAAGFQHTCAIANSAIFCWGLNSYGQLGNGTAGTDQLSPVAVVTSGVLSGKAMKDIATGQYSSCAVAASGEVYCWGKNDDGQLGDGARPVDSNVPVLIAIP